MIVASARTEIAGLISAAVYVYIIMIFAFIVIQLLFTAGLRPPYTRATDAVLQFLRDTCEPFLRLFRRIIPPIGGLDLSPMLAIISLTVLNRVLVEGIIHG